MRYVTFDAGAGPRAGVLDGDAIAEIEGGEGGLSALLRRGPLDGAPATGARHALGGVALLPPVTEPGKVVCIGLNYRSHAEEAGLEAPETPTFFAKFANALAAPGADVPLPRYSEKVDYEAEVAFVIGRRCKDVAAEDALAHVAGFTLLNDLSARDYQFKTNQWMPGKVFDGSAPCGPALVTPDEAGDPIEVSLTLNGERMQHATTDDLIHSVPALIAYLSMLMTLEPGDLVATGTPAGVGSVRRPRVWLKPGDEVVVSSPTLGDLRTRLT